MIIKVISLNIWLGGFLQDYVMAFLGKQDADVVLLQEVFDGGDRTLAAQYRTMQALKENLTLPYKNFAPEYRDFDRTDGRAQLGNAILSRFPIISSTASTLLPDVEASRDTTDKNHHCPYILQHVVLDAPVDRINVFNMHGVWDLDGNNFSPMRQKMSSTVIEAVKNKKNVILAVDMNAKPTNKALISIERYLKSVFGHELTTTFNMRHKSNTGFADAAVDMMFISPSVRVVEHDCPDVDISDHLPLRATLEID